MNYLFSGFTCSLLTDTTVNPLRVIKTHKQAFSLEKSYLDIIKNMINHKGKGSSGFYRGYVTRLAYNAINGSLFVLLWQNLEMVANKRN